MEVGLTITEVCRGSEIIWVTLYKKRANFVGMVVSVLTRMNDLAEENCRPLKMAIDERLKAGIVPGA